MACPRACSQRAGQERRAQGHRLVRVHALGGRLAEERGEIFSCTSGERLCPPTRMTSSMSLGDSALASSTSVHTCEGAVHQPVGELDRACRA